MSDLISRKALLEKLKEYVETVYECNFDDPRCTADGGSLNPKFVEGLWEAKEIIENQPTAYNVDKVVEQIESKMFTAELYGDDWGGQTVSNLICLGDIYEVMKIGMCKEGAVKGE